MKKICIVTGSRAEYGILKPIISKLTLDNEVELQLIATGMHLSPEFGLTYKEIEEDGNKITEKVEILMSSDTSVGICKSIGLGTISFSEIFNRLNPDMVVILGDRYEMFAAATAAMVSKVPIAHIHGGEITEGAFDDNLRHSITKMSYIHFTSTEGYRNRVIQLGEDPRRVFNVGALGVENINSIKLLSRSEVEKELNINIEDPMALVTYHPVTLENNTSKEQMENLLKALDKFENLNVIFTKANSDTEGRIINGIIDNYVLNNYKKARVFASLGTKKYLSVMKLSSAVIGNSSSGIIEAPTFNIPTVNIGDRQKGRVQASQTVNCDNSVEGITFAIDKALKSKIQNIVNPYYKENTSDNIITIIKTVLSANISLKKHFFDFTLGDKNV